MQKFIYSGNILTSRTNVYQPAYHQLNSLEPTDTKQLLTKVYQTFVTTNLFKTFKFLQLYKFFYT